MNLLFDARVIQDHFPGIGRYALNLLRALPDVLSDSDRLTVVYDPGVTNTRMVWSPSELPASQVTFVECRTPVFGMSNVIGRGFPRVPGAVAHFPYYVRPVRGVPTVSVTNLHDAILFVYPSFAPSARARLTIRALHHLSIRASKAVLTLSRSAANDLIHFFPSTVSKLVTIAPAADPVFVKPAPAACDDVRARFGLPARFALFLASNKPHKNLARLVEAWRIFHATPVGRDAVLIVAGHRDPRYRAVETAAASVGTPEQTIRFVGPVSDADAAALYAMCEVFVFPSLYEGFGLTPLEAMQCGAPVICSNVSSLPEVAGSAAIQIDPSKPGEIAEAISRVWNDPGLRAEMHERSLAQAARFTWSRVAYQTLQVYRSVIEP
jgi:glycosyltransferase involved in cell wall biosynthesis